MGIKPLPHFTLSISMGTYKLTVYNDGNTNNECLFLGYPKFKSVHTYGYIIPRQFQQIFFLLLTFPDASKTPSHQFQQIFSSLLTFPDVLKTPPRQFQQIFSPLLTFPDALKTPPQQFQQISSFPASKTNKNLPFTSNHIYSFSFG